MKKIIPFTSDIKFNTKIYEITSISLEHNLTIESNNIITGEFIVSGEYKMNDTSINTEPFIQGIPFDITLDCKYDMDRIKIDIDDFKFEIINEEALRVNIDVLIEGIELVEMEEENIIDEIKPDLIIEPRKEEVIDEVIEENTTNIEEVTDNVTMDDNEMRDNMDDVLINDLFKQTDEVIQKVSSISEDKNDIKESNIDSIFNNISTFDEKYVTYYVHIVRENDTIDSICSKYGIDIAILKEYNNTEQITLGSKIIVPYIQSETI